MKKTTKTKKEVKKPEPVETPVVAEKTEKEILLDLYKTLKDLGVNSIGDLEVKISRL